jgi:hypothetical protein
MTTSLLVLLTFAPGQPATADTYYDFRGQPLSPELTVFPAKEGVVKVEQDGLRITLPRSWIHPFGGVGVKTASGLRGDFEVTAGFEVLQADVPDTGFGVGVCLGVQRAGSRELANLCRLVRDNGKPILYWEYSIEKEPDAKLDYKAASIPGPAKEGRLRLKRTGSTLHFLWSPGTKGEEFQEIHKAEFGAGDIKHVRLVGLTGRQPRDLDARFLDLRIRSAAPPVAAQAPEKGPASTPPAPGARSFWWLLTLAVIVLVVAGGAVLMRLGKTKRSSALQPREEAPVPATKKSAAAEKPVEVQCPSCHKRLKLSASMVGKKVKCPGCGTALLA